MRLLLFLIFFAVVSSTQAQRVFCGQIQAKAVTSYTYRITLDLYVENSYEVPTKQLTIYSDNYTVLQVIQLPIKSDEELGWFMRRKIYELDYTFPSPPFISGTYYRIGSAVANRSANLYNVPANLPDFVAPHKTVYLETRLLISNNLLNEGLTLGNDIIKPILKSRSELPFNFNWDLQASNPTADSLSYEVAKFRATYNTESVGAILMYQSPIIHGVAKFESLEYTTHVTPIKIRQWRRRIGSNEYYEISSSHFEILMLVNPKP